MVDVMWVIRRRKTELASGSSCVVMLVEIASFNQELAAEVHVGGPACCAGQRWRATDMIDSRIWFDWIRQSVNSRPEWSRTMIHRHPNGQ